MRSDVAQDADSSQIDRALIEKAFAETGYDLADHAAHVLRRAHQRASSCFHSLLGEFGITPTQHAALATLLRQGELSQNQLGRLTAMDPSTISIVVRKLVKDGLVKGTPSPTDSRLTMLSLTPRGVEFTLPLLQLSLDSVTMFLSPLNGREQATFLKLLKKVAAEG